MKRVAAGAALVGAVLITASLSTVASRYAREEAESAIWVEHTHVVLDTLTALGAHVTAAENGLRAYALGRDTSLLQEVEPEVDAALANVHRARDLTRDNPEQQRRLDELDPQVQHWSDIIQRRFTLLKNAQPDLKITPAEIRVSESIRRRLDELIKEERALLQRRNVLRQTQAAHVEKVAVVGPLVAILLVMGATILLLREMARGRQAARELQVKHQQIESIIEGTTDAIYAKDVQGRFTLVNSACARIIGRPAQAILGTTVADFLPADIAAIISQNDQEVLRTGLTRTIEENAPVDGVNRIFLSTKGPQRDADHKLIGIIGISRDMTQLREAEMARVAEMNLHLGMGELLQASRTLDESYDVINQMVPRFFREESGAIYLFHASRDHLEVHGSWGLDTAGAGAAFGPDDCWALRRGQPLLVEGENGMACKHAAGVKVASMLCIPLLAYGEVLGILHLRSDKPMDASVRKRAQLLSEQIAMALANAKLRETLRNQSIRDSLTGLFNRRYTEETLTREIHRAERQRAPLAVLAIDVDHFKRFNDTYGHEAGDQVLRAIGAHLMDQTRGGDVASRMGGEELLVLLPSARLEDACAKAEQLRAAIKQIKVTHRGAPIGPVTISIGVAAFPEHGRRGDEILRSADLALYKAKHGGRDRVIASENAVATESHSPNDTHTVA